MAITQTLCTSFKKALLDGKMDFSVDTMATFKMALYTSTATLDATTTMYDTTNEIVSGGYTAGGTTLTVVPATTSGTTAYTNFADPLWAITGTATIRGALIYLSTDGGVVEVDIWDGLWGVGDDSLWGSTWDITVSEGDLWDDLWDVAPDESVWGSLWGSTTEALEETAACAIAVLDFGADKIVTNATFEVQLPTNTATTALIRIV